MTLSQVTAGVLSLVITFRGSYQYNQMLIGYPDTCDIKGLILIGRKLNPKIFSSNIHRTVIITK